MPLPQTHTIETERLLLRILTPATYDVLFAASTDKEIIQFLGLKSAEELQQERLRQEEGRVTWRISFVNFQLIEKESGVLIGSCGFHTWCLPHFRAEIGYAISSEEHKNKGYMKEAMKAVLDYGFDKMKLNRVEAFIGPANEASVKLVTGLGFRHEGLLRGHYYKNGAAEDSAVYGLLREDYMREDASTGDSETEQ